MKTFRPAWLSKPLTPPPTTPASDEPGMRYSDDRDQELNRFYASAAWRSVRALRLALNPLCQSCSKVGITKSATIVHHVKPVKEGGEPLDLNNTESCCHRCHNARHSEKGKWRRG